MQRKWFVSALLPLFSSVALAQTGTIAGTVRSEGGQPVASANVLVLGTRSGAMTRDDGRYSVAVNPGNV